MPDQGLRGIFRSVWRQLCMTGDGLRQCGFALDTALVHTGMGK